MGGGNTDANRQVGVPYPFRAAAAKHGGAGGAANETLLRWEYRLAWWSVVLLGSLSNMM